MTRPAQHRGRTSRRGTGRAARRGVTLVLALALAVVALLVWPSRYTLTPYTSGHLELLASMNAKQAEKYLDKHPEAVAAMLDSVPKEIATWWRSLAKRDRRELIRADPAFVGNLKGVDYASRDRANRKQLKTALAEAAKAVKKNPGNALDKLTLQSLTAIKGSIRKSYRAPRRYLISLTDTRPPLAAVALGNLDTAHQITYNIPGMGTYTSDMQLWCQSAQNVYDEQGTVGAPAKRAVVAWIGYQTPPPGIAAALGDYAARGAPHLRRTIRGLRAVRKPDPPKTVNIVAHSYGTTTAANALVGRPLDIYAFVMLGSAGIESSIGNADDIGAEHVFAGQARDDHEAQWGRVTRTDPMSPSFGAHRIGVDGTGKLLPVTGHEPVLHSAWNDDFDSSAWSGIKSFGRRVDQYMKHFLHYGYLDAGTESLMNVAIATTRHADRKPL